MTRPVRILGPARPAINLVPWLAQHGTVTGLHRRNDTCDGYRGTLHLLIEVKS